ncbi:MAG: ComEA family DNA-binding protein [Anaerolineales bacterium]|jgi:competence protein ComEA
MFERWTTYLTGLLTGLAAAGLLLLLLSPRKRIPIELHPAPTPGPLQIHIAGAVKQPGVYHLPRPAIGLDALEAAGGALAEADLDRVNLAAELESGQRLYIPFSSADDIPRPQATPGLAVDSASQLNINTATVIELEGLPGIGPSLAGKIVEYRETHGFFNSEDELLDVSGIGPAKLDQLRDLIRID